MESVPGQCLPAFRSAPGVETHTGWVISHRQCGDVSENGIKEPKIGFRHGTYALRAVRRRCGFLPHRAHRAHSFLVCKHSALDAGWLRH